MQPTNYYFQIANVTTDSIHVIVNDHGFEDTAVSRVKHFYSTHLNNLGYYKQ